MSSMKPPRVSIQVSLVKTCWRFPTHPSLGNPLSQEHLQEMPFSISIPVDQQEVQLIYYLLPRHDHRNDESPRQSINNKNIQQRCHDVSCRIPRQKWHGMMGKDTCDEFARLSSWVLIKCGNWSCLLPACHHVRAPATCHAATCRDPECLFTHKLVRECTHVLCLLGRCGNKGPTHIPTDTPCK